MANLFFGANICILMLVVGRSLRLHHHRRYPLIFFESLAFLTSAVAMLFVYLIWGYGSWSYYQASLARQLVLPALYLMVIYSVLRLMFDTTWGRLMVLGVVLAVPLGVLSATAGRPLTSNLYYQIEFVLCPAAALALLMLYFLLLFSPDIRIGKNLSGVLAAHAIMLAVSTLSIVSRFGLQVLGDDVYAAIVTAGYTAGLVTYARALWTVDEPSRRLGYVHYNEKFTELVRSRI